VTRVFDTGAFRFALESRVVDRMSGGGLRGAEYISIFSQVLAGAAVDLPSLRATSDALNGSALRHMSPSARHPDGSAFMAFFITAGDLSGSAGALWTAIPHARAMSIYMCRQRVVHNHVIMVTAAPLT
jgi:hypothetical protein